MPATWPSNTARSPREFSLPGRIKRPLGNSRGLLRRTAKRTRNFPSPCRRNRRQLGQSQFRRRAQLRSAETRRARQRKSTSGASPERLAPGRYTVILEPAAVLDLVGFLFYDFAATALQDKRSCLNERMGKQLFGKNISIYDDAYHPLQLGAPFDGEGMPRQKVASRGSRRAEKSRLFAATAPKSPENRPPATVFRCPMNTAKRP